MSAATLHIHSGELGDALHDMAMDDVAELVPPGEEGRLPERIRGEVTARHEAHEAAVKKGPYPKYELTPEREAIIRARYDGTTRTMRVIGEDIGVPWYTVRDWAHGKLGLRNPADLQPNGPGTLVKSPATPKRRDGNMGTFKPVKPTKEEQSDIEEARAKRNAMVAAASADDEVPADRATGWMSPTWTYTDAIGELISAQWDGSDESLARLAERERFPVGVLRGWIDEQHLKPKATKAPLEPAKMPARSTSLKADAFAAWLDDTSGALSAFVLHGVRDAVVLRGEHGYRLLTPKGDWPDEPISRALIERIVRVLSGGASDASVHGVVYRAEGAGT